MKREATWSIELVTRQLGLLIRETLSGKKWGAGEGGITKKKKITLVIYQATDIKQITKTV